MLTRRSPKCRSAPTSQPMTKPGAWLCITFHRQVVDGSAVDQYALVCEYRRHHARYGHGGAQRVRHPAFTMLVQEAGCEIRAYAEERDAQVLDEHSAILALQ